MDMLLIRIGKAWNVIKRDGFFNGMQRIAISFFKLFQRVGSGDVLFITNGVGDSALYRAHHQAEELRIHGFKTSVTVQDNPFLLKYVDRFNVFVFHRTLYSKNIRLMVEKIKVQGKEIIFDTDDLVFDPEYIQKTEQYEKMNPLEKKLYKNGLGGEILGDPYVKVCTTTTTFLANMLREKNKKVFIVPNKVSEKDVEVADEILKNRATQRTVLEGAKRISEDGPRPSVRIGYFSGTSSHNQDFATITDALMEIMEKYPQVELILAGPLEMESRLNKFKERIKKLPYAARKKHFENKAGVDIVLAPLEINDPFCESKSELKFSESGLLEVPTVAVANQTFREAISDGIDGFVAKGTAEWVEKLEKLITDKEFRINMGKLARDKVMLKYTNRNSNNEEYYNYLRARIDAQTRKL